MLDISIILGAARLQIQRGHYYHTMMTVSFFLSRGQVNAQVLVGYQGETRSYIDY